MTKVCPRCHHMVREPSETDSQGTSGMDSPSCPRCAGNGRIVPLLNAIPVQRPVAPAREPLQLR